MPDGERGGEVRVAGQDGDEGPALGERGGGPAFTEQSEEGLKGVVIELVGQEMDPRPAAAAAAVEVVEARIGAGTDQGLRGGQVGGGPDNDNPVDFVPQAVGRLQHGEQVARGAAAVVAIQQVAGAVEPVPIGGHGPGKPTARQGFCGRE